MTERGALLRAICENPDDDAPRLAFADWLEERGDRSLAEFIRVQIELARIPEAERPSHPLTARQGELYHQKTTWKEVIGHDFQTLLNDGLEHYDRGFHHVWIGDVTHFARLPKDWSRFGPIDTLHILLRTPKSAELKYAEAAAAKPILRKARAVELSGGLTNRWVERFLRLSDVAGWHQFELRGSNLGDPVCRSLVASPLIRSECEVFVDFCRVTDGGRQLLRDAFGARCIEPRHPWDLDPTQS